MPTKSGDDELAAAGFCLHFMEELARRLERHHAVLWGLYKPYRFRGTRVQWGRSLEDHGKPMDPPSLMNIFQVEIREFGVWMTFATFNFWRADWDETPHMRSTVCTLYYPELMPPEAHKNIRTFVKAVFQCEKITFYNSEGVEEMIRIRPA